MKYDFITIGGATEDITFYTREGVLVKNKKDILRPRLLAFEYGTKIKIDKAYSSFGGGAANAAVSLSRFGFKTAALVAIGKDARGKNILSNFRKQRVNISIIQITKEYETGFSFLLVGQGNEHIVFSNRAANDCLKISDRELKKIKKAKWIYLTSLSGEWEDNLKAIFSLNEIKIAWNPGHIQLKAGFKKIGKYFQKTKLLMVNRDEALELVFRNDKKTKGLNNIRNLLSIIKKWGPEIVMITDGKKGAYAIYGNEIYFQDVLKEKKRVDTTGVGDSFGSAFCAGLELYDNNIKKSLHLAAKNSSSVIAEQGAQNGLLSKKYV